MRQDRDIYLYIYMYMYICTYLYIHGEGGQRGRESGEKESCRKRGRSVGKDGGEERGWQKDEK